MTKTPVTYKETLQGILTVREIESIVIAARPVVPLRQMNGYIFYSRYKTQ